MNTKRYLLFLLLLVGIMGGGNSALAADRLGIFTSKGLTYSVYDDNTAILVRISEAELADSKILDIPGNVTYEGKTVRVTEISLNQSLSCSSITTITIPASLVYISHAELNNNLGYLFPNLQYFNVSSDNPAFTEIRNQLLVSKDKSTLVCCPPAANDPTAVIFTGIKKFGAFAFYGCKLQKLIIPSSLEDVDKEAFRGFDELVSFANADKNPNEKYVVYDGVLYEYRADNEGKYTIPYQLLSYPKSKSGTNYGIRYNSNASFNIANYAFEKVKYLENVNCGSLISSYGFEIGDYAFYRSKSIIGFGYSDFITHIGKCAFADSGIKEFRNYNKYSFTGSRTMIIDSCAFSNSSLEYISFPVNVNPQYITIQLNNYALADCPNLKSVILPKYSASPGAGLAPLGKYAFARCTSLEEVDFTNATPGAGQYGVLPKGLFCGCTSLKSVKFDDDKITEIGDKAFSSCNLPSWICSNQTNSLTKIGQLAFYLNNLGDVNFNEFKVLKTIGIGAFFDAGISNKLLSFYTENGGSIIDKIERYTFAKNKIQKITFAEGIREIDESAFIDNPELTNVLLPNSLEKFEWISNRGSKSEESILGIGLYGFFACPKLKKIQINNNETYGTSQHGLLYNKKTMELIHCPEDYTVTNVMGYQYLNVKGLVVENEIPGIKSIAPYCFAYSTLENIVLPSTLESIGTGAFRASAVSSLTIPSSVKKVGSFLFGGAGRLQYDGTQKLELFLMPVTAPSPIEYIDQAVDGKVTRIKSQFYLGLYNVNIYVKKTSYESGTYDDWKEYGNLTYKIPIPSSVTQKGRCFSVCRDFDVNCYNTNLAAYAVYDYMKSNYLYGRTLTRYVPSRVGANHDKYVGAIIQLYAQPGDANYVEDGNWYCIGEHDYASGNQLTRSEEKYLGPNFEYNWLVGCPIPTYVSSKGESKYALKYNADKKVSCWAQYVANGVVPMNKAYLDLTDHEYPSSTQAKELNIVFDDDDETSTTDIDSPIVDINEKQDTERAVYYNLNGMKVEHPTSGIYVRNGKKVIIK